MNSNSLESLNGAQCASVLELDSTGVTTGDGHTHDLRAALRLPFSDRKASPSQNTSHLERALDCKEGAWREDLRPSASSSQSLEREVDAAPQLVNSWCIATREDASSVLIEEAIVVRSCFELRRQYVATLVPVEASEARVDSVSGVASVAQVFVETTTFLEPDRRVARVR